MVNKGKHVHHARQTRNSLPAAISPMADQPLGVRQKGNFCLFTIHLAFVSFKFSENGKSLDHQSATVHLHLTMKRIATCLLGGNSDHHTLVKH